MILAFTNGMPKSCHTMEQYDYFKAILVVQLIIKLFIIAVSEYYFLGLF